MGLFRKREANQAERQVWTMVNATDEIMSVGRDKVETYIGPTTTEYDRLEQAVFAAAADVNRVYATKEWKTLGYQYDTWVAAMGDLNSHLEANNYGPRIEAAEAEAAAND